MRSERPQRSSRRTSFSNISIFGAWVVDESISRITKGSWILGVDGKYDV